MKNTENITKSRRNFLKKAVYAAPAVIILGGLAAPTSAHASYIKFGSVSNETNGRYADIYKDTPAQLVKSVETETDAHTQETIVYTDKSTFLSWLHSFFA